MPTNQTSRSKKFVNFSLFLYVICINFLCKAQKSNENFSLPSYKPQYVFKVDMGLTLNSTDQKYSNPWGVSNFTNNYPMGVKFVQKDEKNQKDQGYLKDQTTTINLDAVSTTQQINLDLGDESLGVQINSMNILKNKQEYLNFGTNISLVNDISPRISPRDYIDKKLLTPVSSLNTPCVSCKYTNNGPFYKRAILRGVDIDHLVSLYNKNLGIKNEQLGIKLITMENFTLTYQPLDDYISKNSNGEEFSKTNNMNFTKLLLTQDFRSYDMTKFVLAALTDKNDLYIYNITDNSYTNFNIRQWDVIKTDVFNITNINKVGVFKDNVYITSQSGLFILKKNSANQWINTYSNYKTFIINNATETSLTIKDSLLVNSTLFMIVDNFGLISFDMNTMKVNSNYFLHPRLVQLDYTAFRNLFYIGVLIDNQPPSVPEFFIEFAFNYDSPGWPLINKVFISDRDINIKDIGSDDMLGLTYIMEPGSSNLYILTRGIANTIPTYNFVVDFRGYYNFDSSRKIELMFISENDAFFPSLVINSGKDYILFGRFNYPRNTLTCKMNVDGDYTYSFTTPMDCSNFVNGKFSYNTCWNNATVRVKADSSIKDQNDQNDKDDKWKDHSHENDMDLSLVPHDEGENIGLWVALGIGIIAVFAIVVTVVCCRHRICRKDSKGMQVPGSAAVSYMKQSANGEEVEVHVMDNKL